MRQLVCLVTLFLPISPVFAGTIASTYGPGGTFTQGLAWGTVGPGALAYPFSVPTDQDYSFSSASLALSDGIGAADSTSVILAANAAGVPGVPIETFFVTGLLPSVGGGSSVSPTIVTSVLHPLLSAGTVYWLIIAPPSGNGVAWLTANILTTPDLQASLSNGNWTASPLLYGYNNPGAFSVDATVVAAAPEVGALPLAAGGLGFLFYIRRSLR